MDVTVVYDDGAQAQLCDYMTARTLARLIDQRELDVRYGRYDGDDGDDERIGDIEQEQDGNQDARQAHE